MRSSAASLVGFNPERLEAHKESIIDLLNQLPEGFQNDSGGGWSFLNACDTRNGGQWTGEQRVMEQLVCLGIGIKRVKFLMPKENWDMFPGGMPYFSIHTEDLIPQAPAID